MATKSGSKRSVPQLATCHVVICWPDDKLREVSLALAAYKQLESHTVSEGEGMIELERLVDRLKRNPESDLLLLLLIGPCDKERYTKMVPFLSKRIKLLSNTFVCLLDTQLSESAGKRLELADIGVNMVTSSVEQSERCVKQVLSYILTRQQSSSLLSCPECGLSRLGEDDLWNHFPLYHVINANMSGVCPICGSKERNIAVHLHDHHGPAKRGEVVADSLVPRINFNGFAFSIVRRSDKYLVVQEFLGQGYWFPAGRVDRHETFQEAAVREAKEEAGIDIKLTGILTIHHFPHYSESSKKPIMEVCVYFVASMLDENQQIKTTPDYESAGACWATADEICDLRLRNIDIISMTRQVESGAPILPLTALDIMNLS